MEAVTYTCPKLQVKKQKQTPVLIVNQRTDKSSKAINASQQEGPGFDSRSGHFFLEFAWSPCVYKDVLSVLQLPQTVQKHANWELG